MDNWTALFLGLAGSLHCAGMCGPLALALPATGGTASKFFLGRLAYNAGRMVTYGLLGLVFGLFGKTLFLAGVQRWVSLLLGLVLLAGLFSSRKLASWLPVLTFVERLKQAMAPLLRRRSVLSLAALGLLNGLLPCGLVYVAGAGAAATGDILAGAEYMAVFGVGTVPMMLAIGLSGALIPLSLRLRLRKAVPIAIFLLAALLILRGLSLGIPYLSPDLSRSLKGSSCCD